MHTVTSKDGTKIAFGKGGSDTPVILVNGAMSFRAFDLTMAQVAERRGARFARALPAKVPESS
jgi:hypothetical protein